MTDREHDPAANSPLEAQDTRPALTLDVALYEGYLEDSDLTEDQRRDFLEALWSILVGFVDLGFGVHPLQQAGLSCEQNADFLALEPPDVVSSSSPSNTIVIDKQSDRSSIERPDKEES